MNGVSDVASQFPRVNPSCLIHVLTTGSSYVNIYGKIIKAKHIADNERELCISFANICSTIGITLASVWILIMDNTFLARD